MTAAATDASPATGALARFSRPTARWFTESFEAPTAAQEGAWEAIADGDHALVVAPTGSGKTLAAFLWSLDRIIARGAADGVDARDVASSGTGDAADTGAVDVARTRVLYVSPLKALAVDVERNLRSPLVGIRRTAQLLGLDVPDVRVGLRTGDTPPAERRRLLTNPPDILITTPESLFLLLTSQGRSALTGIDTVILDEVHVLADSKRGAHLALSLERLDALLPAPAQRIGLSATVRPVETVMEFLSGARPTTRGGRPTRLVQPPSQKVLRIDVETPVADLTELAVPPANQPETLPSPQPTRPSVLHLPGPSDEDLSGVAAGATDKSPDVPSVWPHVVDQLLDLILTRRTTLVFANSRRSAERLTARLNEEWQRRRGEEELPDTGTVWAAHLPGQSGTSLGASEVIARSHHGSMSKEERARVEDELKQGLLPAVVATSSLELGIDMGSIDLVVQIGAPPSVASALQRIGRAGHQVGVPSHGIVVPTHRADLLPAAVAAIRARAGKIEHLRPPRAPLDVLAQQIVAMLAVEDWDRDELADLVRLATPFRDLGDAALDGVLDMLAGKYPAEDFASLRARIVWDRETGALTGRPGVQRLAVTSGGTIPDRGLFGVFLVTGAEDVTSRGGGKRVGELDEEMVFESRAGDTFTLGTSTWRIERITPDRVLVSPAPGQPGRLPFWKGDAPPRPVELGAELGRMVREISTDPAGLDAALDSWDLAEDTRANLVAYLSEQQDATGALPTDRTIVVERFRDDIGDWRMVVHSPFGSGIHAPWALLLGARLRERLGSDVGVMHADDGIVLRLPDVSDAGEQWGPPGSLAAALGRGQGSFGDGASAAGAIAARDLVVDAEDVQGEVVAALGGSAHFAARFREAAARSLLLPRANPTKRQPLWQQRQRASQLLAVASRYPDFPIVLEAVRECLQDDFDTPGLEELMRAIARREVRVVEVTTPSPSPMARSLLFSYVGQFLYDGDAPLAERRAAALTLDPTLLAELLGQSSTDLADLLDPAAVLAVEAEVTRRHERYRVRDVERLADLLATLGPLPLTGIVDRSSVDVVPLLTELVRARRAIEVRVAGVAQWAAVEDAGRLRDALGVALPTGIPDTFLDPVDDPLGDLLRRHARTHGPFTAAEAATRFGLGVGAVRPVLEGLVADGVLTSGRLRPPDARVTGAGVGPATVAGREATGDVTRVDEGAEIGAPSDRTGDASGESVAAGTGGTTDLDAATGGAGGGIAPATDDHVADVADVADVATVLATAAGVVEYCDVEVLRRMRRRSLSAARADVEAVSPAVLGTFAPRWHQVGQLRGVDGVVSVVEQLAGYGMDLADLETSILPARVLDYAPAMLDELTSAGEVMWVGRDAPGSGSGGEIVLLPADTAQLLVPEPRPTAHQLAPAVLAALGEGGRFFRDIVARVRETEAADGRPQPSASDVEEALWDAVWAGLVTNDTLAPVRALAGSSRARAPRTTAAGRPRRLSRTALLSPSLTAGTGAAGHAAQQRVATPPTAAGRWSLVPPPHDDEAVRRAATVATLLERHGVVLRTIATAEGLPGGFSGIYPTLAALEDRGVVRRGYLVEGQGAAQFALADVVDRLRADARVTSGALVLAACDPANPYGGLLPWPTADRSAVTPAEPVSGSPAGAVAAPPAGAAAERGRPRRVPGADVVLVDGELVAFLERGAGSVLTFSGDDARLAAAATALAAAAPTRHGGMAVRRVDGENALTTQAPMRRHLVEAGFVASPGGLKIGRRRA